MKRPMPKKRVRAPARKPRPPRKASVQGRAPRTKSVYKNQAGPVVTLAGAINYNCVRKLTRLLDNEPGPITISISSQGGDIDAAMAMHELMRLRVESGGIIMTIGMGGVMSAAVLILCAGTPGYRKMTRFSRLLYHESSTAISGTVSRLRSEVKALVATDSDFDGLVASYTGRTLAEVRRLYAKGDNWMDATEVLDFGFVDELI